MAQTVHTTQHTTNFNNGDLSHIFFAKMYPLYFSVVLVVEEILPFTKIIHYLTPAIYYNALNATHTKKKRYETKQQL